MSSKVVGIDFPSDVLLLIALGICSCSLSKINSQITGSLTLRIFSIVFLIFLVSEILKNLIPCDLDINS